jgi:hypothetical protein
MLRLDIAVCKECGKTTGTLEPLLTRRIPIMIRLCAECNHKKKTSLVEGPISYESFIGEFSESIEECTDVDN